MNKKIVSKEMEQPKDLNRILQVPSIKQLIVELDKLGYELYIKPKPLRTKEILGQLDTMLKDSIAKEKLNSKFKKKAEEKAENNK